MRTKMYKLGIWIFFVIIFILAAHVEARHSSVEHDQEMRTGSAAIATKTARAITRRPKVAPRAQKTTISNKIKLYNLQLPNTDPTALKIGRQLNRRNRTTNQLRSLNGLFTGNKNNRNMFAALLPAPEATPQHEIVTVTPIREEVDNATVLLRETVHKAVMNYTDVFIESGLANMFASTDILRGLANGSITVHDFYNHLPQLLSVDAQQTLMDLFKLYRKDGIKYANEANTALRALVDMLEIANAETISNNVVQEIKDTPSFLRSAYIWATRGLENALVLNRWGVPYRKFRYRK